MIFNGATNNLSTSPAAKLLKTQAKTASARGRSPASMYKTMRITVQQDSASAVGLPRTARVKIPTK
jgi:hypothetical protein